MSIKDFWELRCLCEVSRVIHAMSWALLQKGAKLQVLPGKLTSPGLESASSKFSDQWDQPVWG